MLIRPFQATEAEYEAIVTISNVLWPRRQTTVGRWRHVDEARGPKYVYQRYVAEKEGAIVAFAAYGETFWSYQPGKFEIGVSVHPAQQHRGTGTALYDRLLDDLRPLGATKLTAYTREDHQAGRRFLETRGFRPVMRSTVSELELATFDAGRFAHKVEQVIASGIQLKTLAQLMAEDPDWKEKIYELELTLERDVPSPEETTGLDLATYEKLVLSRPGFLPEAWFVALDGDRYVGMSCLWRKAPEEKALGTGLTGVRRAYRRRGIATALKVSGIRFAQAAGKGVIRTTNEENNPMLDLNRQLGFRPTPAWLDYVKELNNGNRRADDEATGT